MNTYKTPGVFLEETAKLPPSVATSETAIPAFIGHTFISNRDANGIHPVRISSMLEYEQLFGTAEACYHIVEINDTVTNDVLVNRSIRTYRNAFFINTLYYDVQLYFANGGGPCYIVSAGPSSEAVSTAGITAALDAAGNVDQVTLLVIPAATLIPAAYTEEMNEAAMAMDTATNDEEYEAAVRAYNIVADNSYASGVYNIYKIALEQCALLKNRMVIIDVAGSKPDLLRGAYGIGTEHLAYGAAYYPQLKVSIPAVSDDNRTSVYYSINHVAQNGGFIGTNPSFTDQIKQVARQAVAQMDIVLNPGAAIAGVYASVDRTRGVWKAPANVSLNRITGTLVDIGDEDQAVLNTDPVAGKSINAIRNFSGRGILVWGARTLAGNDNEWRYVPVRRLFNMLETDIKKAAQDFVFENNDANTWVKLRAAINNYLVTLWRDGALQGAKPEDAFYIAVGLGQTMTTQDVLEGRMIVEVGVAAVRPAEFIILRFSHMMAQR